MKTKKNLLIAIGIVVFAGAVHAGPIDDGKTIFSTRCAACHNINNVMVGPALAGVDQRRDIDWIIKFVHSSQTVVKSGDTYAVALFDKFNKIPMPDHPDLSIDQIKSVVEYIKSESQTGGSNKPPFSVPGKKRPSYLPLSITDYGFFAGYLGVVAMLIVSLLFAVQLKSFQRDMRKEK